MKTKLRKFGAWLMAMSLAFAGAGAVQAAVTLPAGMTSEADWTDANPVKYGDNYYATLKAAVEAAYDAKDTAIVIYCKPGADVGTMTHGHVVSDLTVYGNDAYVSGGEHDFEVDTYKGKAAPAGSELTGDITLNIFDLNGCAVWGQRNSDYKVTINLTGCKNVNRIYFSTAKGTIDINVDNCTFVKANGSSKNTSIKTDSQGTWKITNTTFDDIAVAIAATNENGPADVTVKNCTFIDCATKANAADQGASDYASPIRVLGRSETTLKVDGCTFSYSDGAKKNFSDIVIGEIRANKAASAGVSYDIVNTVGEIDVIKPHAANVTIADFSTKITVTEETKATPVKGDSDSVSIGTPADLVAFSAAVNGGKTFRGKTVVLAADIDMAGVDFQPIGNVAAYPSDSFAGTFDGQNHTISNLKASDFTPEYATAGLFGSLCTGAVVQNLKLVNPEIRSSHYAGAIVGYISEGPVMVVNCSVEGGSVKSTPELLGSGYDNGDKVGGILGYSTACGSVSGCEVKNLTISAYRDIGGIAGYLDGTVSNCKVADTTIVQDDTNAYKSEPITTVAAICGKGSGASGTTGDNVSTGVEFVKVNRVTPKVEDPQGVITDTEVAEKIEQNTKVEGVQLSVTATDEKPAGVQAVVADAKAQDETFAAAVEAAAEVSVKVEVEVKPTEYDKTADKGKVAFELTPKATVTVVQDQTELKQTVPVTNDMIDQSQKIAVSIYTGFRPMTILHKDGDNLIEIFGSGEIVYDETTGVATVRISHFSTLLATQEENDPYVKQGYFKVSSGFYQNAATYQDATEFYITSKDGFHAFRDLINQDNGVIENYIAKEFYNSTVDQFYTNNPFNGKKVKLLCDVDEGDVAVKPIGMTKDSRADEKDKRYFYGAFDGCNHKISNLRVIDDPPASKHRVGLFGNVTCNGYDTGIYNLTIENAYISGYNYVGGFIGGTVSGTVISNCCLKGEIHITGVSGYVGGMLGHGGADFYDCKVLASAGSTIRDGSWASGGIVGYWSCNRKMYNCHAEGYAGYSPYYAVGSMAGYLEGGNVVSNCTASDIVLTGKANEPSAMGAIVGNNGCEVAAPAMVIDCQAENVTVWANNGAVQVYGQVGSEVTKEGRDPIVGWDVEGELIEGGVVGGTFESLPDSYVAAGYEKVAQGTMRETWVVQLKPATDTASAQAALDAALPGATVVLKAGDYGTLYLRNNGTGANRILKDVTIVAEQGAVVTVGQIAYQRIDGKSLDVENLTIDGLVFDEPEKSAVLFNEDGGHHLRVNGLTVRNCEKTGNNSNGTTYDNAAFIGCYYDGAMDVGTTFAGDATLTCGYHDIKILNNRITNVLQPIKFPNEGPLYGLTVTGNTFTGCTDNHFMLSTKTTGDVVISNNTIVSMTGRFARISGAQSDAKFTFSDNVVTTPHKYDTGDDGSIVKITGTAGFTVSDTGNRWLEGSFDAATTTWIANGDPALLPPPVAEIVATGKKYVTLAEAVAAVGTGLETPTEIRMLANETMPGNNGVTIPGGKDIVLDLNGFRICNDASESNHSATITIETNGKLTVKDTSDGSNGVIINAVAAGTNGDWGSTPRKNWESDTVSNHGTFVLESGNVVNTTEGISYCVDNHSNVSSCTFVMNGGKLYNNYGDQAVRVCANSGASINQTLENRFEMHGGEIVTGGFWVQMAGAIGGSFDAAKNWATVVVDGGTVNGFVDVGNSGTCDVEIGGDAVINASKMRFRSLGGADKFVRFTGGRISIPEFDDQTGDNYFPAVVSGGVFTEAAKTGLANYVIDGSVFVPNTDAETKADYPWTVGPQQLQPKTEGAVTTTEGVNIGLLPPEQKTDAVAKVAAETGKVTETLTSPVVTQFTETNVGKTLFDAEGAVTPAYKEALAASTENPAVKAAINASSGDTNTTGKIKIDLKEMSVGVEMVSDSVITTLNKVSYDVKPILVTEVTYTEGDEVKTEKVETEITAELLGGNPITFRLAVGREFVGQAHVRHWATEAREGTPIEEYYTAVLGGGDNKYVEIKSAKFSPFDVLNANDVQIVCEVGGNMYATIADAIDDSDDSYDTTIELLADIDPAVEVTGLGLRVIKTNGKAFNLSQIKVAEAGFQTVTGKDGSMYVAKEKVDVPFGTQGNGVPVRGFEFPTYVETADAKAIYLAAVDEVAGNGNTRWQNYVLFGNEGVGVTMPKLIPQIVKAVEGSSVVTIKAQDDYVLNKPVRSGVGVKFQLMRSDASATTGFVIVDEPQDEPVFQVDVKKIGVKTYWKIQTIFETTEDLPTQAPTTAN